MVSGADMLNPDPHFRNCTQVVRPEAELRILRSGFQSAETQTESGDLEMVDQTAETDAQAGEEEPSFPVSVADCIRALNHKAFLEEGSLNSALPAETIGPVWE